jgi:hypothetical protein
VVQLPTFTGVLWQGPDEASSKRHEAVSSPAHFTLEARGSSTPVAPVTGQPSNDNGPPGDEAAAGSAPRAEGTGADARRVTRQNSRKRKHDRDCDDGGSREAAFPSSIPARLEQASEREQGVAAATPGDPKAVGV